MRKKQRHTIRVASAALAGQLPFKAETCQALEPVMRAAVLLGYYLGHGHSLATAGKKASKIAQEMDADD